MKKNVGTLDRIIRVILGAGFVVLGFTVSYWFMIGAVIMLFTAAAGVCPLYIPFGINTNKKNK